MFSHHLREQSLRSTAVFVYRTRKDRQTHTPDPSECSSRHPLPQTTQPTRPRSPVLTCHQPEPRGCAEREQRGAGKPRLIRSKDRNRCFLHVGPTGRHLRVHRNMPPPYGRGTVSCFGDPRGWAAPSPSGVQPRHDRANLAVKGHTPHFSIRQTVPQQAALCKKLARLFLF